MIDKLFVSTELPSPDNKIMVFSDGNDDYTYVLPEYYPETCIEYGQIVKIKGGGNLRERVGRLVRKTKCYSKSKSRLGDAIELIQFYWNFMDVLHDKKTPAIIEMLTDYIWNWDDFLTFHYAV